MSGAREHIAWAADVPLDEALRLWPLLSPAVGVVKVGLSLFVEHGPAAVRPLQTQGAAVFLDLKLHDIPNTVENAAAAAGSLLLWLCETGWWAVTKPFTKHPSPPPVVGPLTETPQP